MRTALMPVLSAALFLLAFGLGCARLEHPVAADAPPTAPPPRPKRTTAELLVGTWQEVKIGEHRLPPDFILLLEFAGDGTLTHRFVVRSPAGEHERPSESGKGTYRLEGNTVHLKFEATATKKGHESSMLIESITDAELIIAAGKDKPGGEYKRLPAKPPGASKSKLLPPPSGEAVAKGIVGTWERVKHNGLPRPPGAAVTTYEFTKDGFLNIRDRERDGKEELKEAKYRLDGRVARIWLVGNPPDGHTEWTMSVEFLTDETMVVEEGRNKNLREFRRITEKDDKK